MPSRAFKPSAGGGGDRSRLGLCRGRLLRPPVPVAAAGAGAGRTARLSPAPLRPGGGGGRSSAGVTHRGGRGGEARAATDAALAGGR